MKVKFVVNLLTQISINILLFKCCRVVLPTGAMIYVHYLCLAYFFTLHIKTKLQTLLLLLSLAKVFFSLDMWRLWNGKGRQCCPYANFFSQINTFEYFFLFHQLAQVITWSEHKKVNTNSLLVYVRACACIKHTFSLHILRKQDLCNL